VTAVLTSGLDGGDGLGDSDCESDEGDALSSILGDGGASAIQNNTVKCPNQPNAKGARPWFPRGWCQMEAALQAR
jgi:hypothetical protein